MVTCIIPHSKKNKEALMPTLNSLSVSQLNVDLDNFRTVHQTSENHAVETMITIKPDWFWALMQSLLDDGYLPTENIIVLKVDGKYIVKEGNRRIADLKIIHGMIVDIDLPDEISLQIKSISKAWKNENSTVPCSIYKSSESKIVDRIVSLIHGKGEKAGRDKWTAVARARHDRDKQGHSEPGLDLLEKYLEYGKNLTEAQSERWSGDYPLTVLNEAMQKMFSHMGLKSIAELLAAYPKKHKRVLDRLAHDIGMLELRYKDIRDTQNFFGERYIVINTTSTANPSSQDSSISTDKNKKTSSSKPIAHASNDPKAVFKKLRGFKPVGNGREKLVTLLKEIKRLNIENHPHAFCFLLRSMFELSAKAYCADFKGTSSLSLKKNKGNDKTLASILRDITKHMTNNNKDKEKVKLLHGAMTEIATPNGLLSVTSLNQLVHNPSFSIAPNHICILFGNIFPLLEEMNN
jgi:hypothetical protein